MKRAASRAGHVMAMAMMLACAASAQAQEATLTPAATQPAEGNWYLRQKVQYLRLGRDPSPADRDIDKIVATTLLSYGVTRDVSLTLDVPVEFESSRSNASGEVERSFGVNDIGITAKWRPLQWDLGPVDSVRVAFIAGVEVPTFDGKFSSQGVDPIVGGVVTAILGRHGFNQALRYKFTTDGQPFPTRAGDGDADALFYDTSYLFRLAPEEYAADTEASTYLTLELNGVYETNGDNEVILGPGILYEARTFALEATVGLPIVRDVDERPTADVVVTVGFRILF
jgi:hypothetical protein